MDSQAESQGEVPVYVIYNLPWRGCDTADAGGSDTPAEYESYIDGIATGLAQANAVVVVEPDALSELDCLTSAQQSEYYELITYAVQQLSQDANAHLYIDAGHPDWEPVSTEASRLLQVIDAAGTGTNVGFALNVSNYWSTASDIAYGTQISEATGGLHFVIDTSRNGGDVPDEDWCNAPDALLGPAPTTNTGNALVDAYLWIKPPGASDGTCNGGPAAGQLWMQQELELLGDSTS